MKYNAFISYRHSDLDMFVAKKVHKKLETFKVPHSVTEKSGKKSIERVFRDQEELPIGSDLGDNIRQALSESEYLIVICSPRTPESYWVQKEIDTFIEMHGREHILAVLAEGEPDEAFPKQLLRDDEGNPVEPLAADVRGISKKEVNKKMRTEIVRLAAPLLGCSYDDLRQRHRERQLKKAFCMSSLAAVFAISFGCYSAYNYIAIQKNYKGKLINQSKYLADTAINLLEDGDRITAGLIALEALPYKNNNRPYVASAQYALSESLNVYENGNTLEKDCLLKHDFPVEDMIYNSEGTKLVTIDNGGNVYVWDVIKGTLIIKLTPEADSDGIVGEPLAAMVTKDNNLIIATDTSVSSYDLEGNKKWCIDGEDKYISCTYNLETETAAWISDSIVSFIDLTGGKSIGSMEASSDKYVFCGNGAFSEDNNRFLVGSIAAEDSMPNGILCVYDFKAGSKTEYNAKGTFTSELCFSADGNIIVLSKDAESIRDLSGNKINGYIQKIDIASKNPIWEKTVKMESWNLESLSQVLKCRKYTDEDIYDEVLLSVDNIVYVWDSQTGDTVSEIGFTCGVKDMLVSAESGLGYILESNGVINIFDLTNGTNYSELSVELGKSARNILSKNQILAAIADYSPDIVIMKGHEGYGMEQTVSLEESISKMDYSLDESRYVIETYEDMEKKYHFYNTEDNSLIAEWILDNNDSGNDSQFTGNTDYAIVTMGGDIVFYNLDTEEENKIGPKEEMIGAQSRFSQNGRYAFVYSAETYYLADLKEQKIVFEGENEESVYDGAVSDDGRYFYGCTFETEVIRIDTKTGKCKKVDLGGHAVSGASDEQTAFAVSPDGKLLAVRCSDNMLRIYEVNKGKVVDKVEFISRTNCFIRFSDDSSKLVMQGDSYYFRVYDVDRKEFAYLSKGQNNRIIDIIYNEGSGIVCVLTTSEMLILNIEDYEPLAVVGDGLCYMPEHNYVFNMFGDNVYRYPYMNLEMLIKEADNQFGNAKLTKRERTQYNVD